MNLHTCHKNTFISNVQLKTLTQHFMKQSYFILSFRTKQIYIKCKQNETREIDIPFE